MFRDDVAGGWKIYYSGIVYKWKIIINIFSRPTAESSSLAAANSVCWQQYHIIYCCRYMIYRYGFFFSFALLLFFLLLFLRRRRTSSSNERKRDDFISQPYSTTIRIILFSPEARAGIGLYALSRIIEPPWSTMYYIFVQKKTY